MKTIILFINEVWKVTTCFFWVGFITLFQLPCTQAKDITSAPQLDKVTLQLKWVHQFNFAGYYAAAEKGFYREVGLDVTIKEGKPGQDFVDEVVSGRANYGVEMPELLIARNNGKPVVALAAIFQHSPQIILARADSGIKSPHDLIGKKLMWRFDSAAELRAMLINESVTLDQIQFQELSWDIKDLIDGKVDAIHAYITDQPLFLQKAGIESTLLQPINYGIDFYGDCLFTSEKEIDGNPERVKNFREASLKGWAYAMENPEEIMEIIRVKYKSKSSHEFMVHEYEHINTLMLPKLVDIGHINPGRWKHIGDTFVELGMLDQNYSLDGFLYNPDPKPDYSKIMKLVWILLSLISIILLSVFALIFYNRKLNIEVHERTKHLTEEIAERKKAHQALVESEKRFKDLADNSTDWIWEFDENEIFTYSSPRIKDLLGFLPEEIIGQSAFDPLSSADSEKVRKEFHRHKECRKPFSNLRNVNHHKNGQEVVLESSGIPIFDNDGIFRGYRGIDRDITERENYEEQLRQAHKMEAIGTLAGGIAHDFNNILAAILGYADMARDDIPDYSPAKHQIEEVLKAGNRAKDMVKHILSFSRKQSHKRVPLDVFFILKEALKFLRATIPTNIELRANLDENCGNILADATQIHQVIINLCTNAAQAMEENGGVLEVSSSCCELSKSDLKSDLKSEPMMAAGTYVMLQFTDSGPGIEPQNIDRIFDPYFTTKEVGKGSGMGLSVVIGIVKSHEGMITVESNPGEGTTFRVYFQRIDVEVKRQMDEKKPLPSGHENILIVDDDASIAHLTYERLKALGYRAKAMTNSLETLEHFLTAPKAYDLVITDQTMPEMTGEKLARELLSIRPDLPIIMCTGYSSRIDADKASLIGIKAFIMKPLDNEELARIVRQVLDEQQ